MGIGAAFGDLSTKAILSCGVPRKLNTILDTTSKLNTRGGGSSQELSVKKIKRYNESVSTGELLPHKDLFCFIEEPSVFTRSRWTRKDMGANKLGQAYDQPEQIMAIINNYSTSPSALPFLTSIP